MDPAIAHPHPPPAASRAGASASDASLRGISLGRIFGVEVRLDYSLIVIALLVTFNLGIGLLPAWHPEWPAALTWTIAAAASLAFIASVLLHELSHAVMGRRVGVPIRSITLFLFGGMAHMDTEPARPRAEFLTAIVGPLTSFAIGVVATLLAFWMGPRAPDPAVVQQLEFFQGFGPLASLLLWLGPINILLAVFNLVPGFPLDGGRVLRSVLWWATGDFIRATRWSAFAGQGVSWLLIACGIAMVFGYRIPLLGSGFIAGFWSVLLGWFLSDAARRSYEQVVLTKALDQVSTRSLMLTRFESVPPDMALSAFVSDRILHADQRCFPVAAESRFVGVACLADIRKVPDSEWPNTSVGAVMTAADQLATIGPDEPAARALQLLTTRDVDQLPVLQDGALVGLVRRQDIMKWLGLRGVAARSV